jgi:hypothetical protein
VRVGQSGALVALSQAHAPHQLPSPWHECLGVAVCMLADIRSGDLGASAPRIELVLWDKDSRGAGAAVATAVMAW